MPNRAFSLITFLIASLVAVAKTEVALLPTQAECRESTQYDKSDDTIVLCNADIDCGQEPPGLSCERRATELPRAIGITYCSCLPLSASDPFPGSVCHIYRWHQGSTTTYHCTKGQCGDRCAVPDQSLTVITCDCP